MRFLRGWLIALLIVALGAAGIFWYSTRTVPIPVQVVAVARGRVEESVSSTKAGSVRSRHTADLSVDIAGTIVAIHAREGDRVKEGQHLLSIDRREPEAALSAAEKELAAAEALLEEARARRRDATREFARLDGLKQSQSVSQAEIDAASTQVAVAEATVNAAQARLEARQTEVARAKVVVEKCDLHAPFEGIVSERFVEVGEWATPGRTALRVLDPWRLYVRAELDEVDIAELKVGLAVRVGLDPWKGRKLTGKISRVSPVVSELEEQNRTVEIEAELTGGFDGLDLKPGTSADVEVILRAEDDRLRVPTQALLEGNRVFVAGTDNRVHAVALKIGLRNWEFAEVLEGLQAGDRVIVSLESEKLKDRAAIRVNSEGK